MIRYFAQVDVEFLHSELLDTLRTELGLSTDTAIAKMVRFWIAVLQIRTGGDITDRSDVWIEESVDWRGEPGAFAKLIRRKHVKDGVVIGWPERYGGFDKKRERDRRSQSASRERKRAKVGDGPSASADVSADVGVDIDRGTSLTDDDASSRSPLTSSSSLGTYQDKNSLPLQEPVGRDEAFDPIASVLADARLIPETFGTDWQFVEGLLRSAPSPNAVAATIRALLDGTNGPAYLPEEIGWAARDFAARGDRFGASYFGGFARKARIARESAEGRRQTERERAYIAREENVREAERQQEADALALIADFARSDPQRFEQLRAKAEAAVDRAPEGMRGWMAEAHLATLIRQALQ